MSDVAIGVLLTGAGVVATEAFLGLDVLELDLYVLCVYVCVFVCVCVCAC